MSDPIELAKVAEVAKPKTDKIEFPRIKRLPPYVFNIIGELCKKARREGEDIIDFGMGNPDLADPAAYREQAGRGRHQGAEPSLFGLARRLQAAPRRHAIGTSAATMSTSIPIARRS